jgi:hypothetical protein
MAGYDVYDPKRPNFTMPRSVPPVAQPSTALVDPKRPNWARPADISTGARQAFDVEMGARSQPVAQALAAEKRGPITRGAERLGRVVGRAAPGLRAAGAALGPALGPAAVGAEAVSHFNDYKINDPSVDSSAAGTYRSLREGDFAGAGRSLSKGMLETGMDLGSAVANTADVFLPGQPASQGYNRMLREQFGDQLIDKSGNAAPNSVAAAPARAPLGTPAQASYSNEGRNYANPGQVQDLRAGANPNGQILRKGNSYSGKDIKFGADIMENGTLRSPANVTSLDTSEGFRQDRLALARLAAERASAPGAGAGLIGIGGAGTTTISEDLRAKTSADEMPDGLSPRQQAAFIQAERARRQDDRRIDSAEGIAGMRERGDTNRVNATIGANAADREANREVTMRGQDLTAGSARAANKLAYAQGERDQGNKNRQYELDVAKHGAERAKTMQAERNARDTQLTKNLEASNPGADGKPDMAAVADQRAGIDRAVARLGGNGVQDLSPLDEQRLLAGSKLLHTMKQNAGMLPWKPDALKTIDPLDLTGLRVLANGDRQITRAGKAAGQIIPKRFFDTEEGNHFFGGTKTNRYDILSEGR